MPLVTTIDLLRHGEAEGGEIFRGTTDVALSEKGWHQMHSALAGQAGWQRVVTSPLQRCRHFGEQVARCHNLPHAVVDDFREICFGRWEGRLVSEIQDAEAGLLDAFWQDPLANLPPGGEAVQDFSVRVMAAFWDQVEQARGQHLLLVVHGGVIRAVLGGILQTGLAALVRYEVPPACLTRIKIYHDRGSGAAWPQLVFHNR